MRITPHLLMAAALVASGPVVAEAQGRSRAVPRAVYEDGFNRGVRAGDRDQRRGDRFDYRDESDYGRRDRSWTSVAFGVEFRRGFEDGYRRGFGPDRQAPRGGFNLSLQFGTTPFDRQPGYGRQGRYRDPASATGFSDGYDEGLDAGRDGDRFNPIAERRYRKGDREYRREYGPREAYKYRYREAFKAGYEQGYRDALRYRPRGWR